MVDGNIDDLMRIISFLDDMLENIGRLRRKERRKLKNSSEKEG